MVGVCRRFASADTAQQVVGGFPPAGLSAVTEEAWMLARSMSLAQALSTLIIMFAVGHGMLYKADDRDPDREREVGGTPVQFTPLISISYLSVSTLALALDAPGTFLPDVSGEVLIFVLRHEFDLAMLRITLRVTSVGAIFSVIDAATADSLFWLRPAAWTYVMIPGRCRPSGMKD